MAQQSKTTPNSQNLTALGGGLLLLSLLGITNANAQAVPASSQLQPQATHELWAQDTIPPLRTRLEAEASIPSVDGTITITLRNNSASEITYEAIAATDPRLLESGGEDVLIGLDIPTTISFYQKDGGLIQANISEVSGQDNSFTLEFDQAPTLGEDDNSVVILESGNIYLM